MTREKDEEIERSPLGGPFSRDGITVLISISRVLSPPSDWSIEIHDGENCVTVWEELFATPGQALAEFLRTVDEVGIRTFLLGHSRPVLH